MDKALKAKIDEKVAMSGAIQAKPTWCKSCIHVAEGPVGPYKAYCDMYLDSKPKDVLFDGEECDFYEEK